MIYTTEKINKLISDYEKGFKIKQTGVFFRGNLGERKAGVLFSHTREEIEEYAKCFYDIQYFAEKYCKVLTYEGLKSLHLRLYQIEMIQNYQKHKFFSIFSSRQMGVTTVLNIIMLHELIFGSDKAIIIASEKLLNSQESLEKVREMYRNLPFFLKPGLVEANLKNLVMENGNRLKVISGKSPAVGFQVHRAFLTDFGAYSEETAKQFMSSLIPVMSAIKDTKIVISNTGKTNRVFHKIVQDSERKEGDPQKNFFFTQRAYWWEVSGRDERWKELEIQNLGQEKFDEEYNLSFTDRLN